MDNLSFSKYFFDEKKFYHVKGSVSSSIPCTSGLLVCYVVTIFMAHEMATNKGQPRDDTCKECWMKQTL